METHLLEKEDEFYKENEKLERRTRELMLKVNDVMRIQDNLIRDSLKTKTEITHAKQNNNSLNKKPSELSQDNVIVPPIVDEMGPKGANHFYRTKFKALQIENSQLQSENRRKTGELTKLQKENQTLAEDKEKWFTSYNTAKNTVGKLESQISTLTSKIQCKDTELAALKKEIENMKKDLKNSNLNTNNLEVRLNRALEDNEKLKISIKNVKDEEKEIKDSYRKQINDLTATVKLIEKHKIELLNGFKKQMQLIDNLKKQKIFLQSLKMTQFSEAEYLKILDWKLD